MHSYPPHTPDQHLATGREVSGVSRFRVSGCQGFRVSGCQGFRVSGFQDDFRVSGFQGVRVSGFQDFRVSGFQGFRVRDPELSRKMRIAYDMQLYLPQKTSPRHEEQSRPRRRRK